MVVLEAGRRRSGRSAPGGVAEVVGGSQSSTITSSRGDPGEEGVGRGEVGGSWRGGNLSPSS